jgi:dipeptide/tripeptide permease
MDLTLVVPKALWYTIISATLALALYGGTWLFLHVSNVVVPQRINVAFLGAVGLALAVAGVMDMSSREMKEVTLEYAQVAALNPLMVMIIIPLLNVAVWAPLSRRDIKVRPLQKMTAGMFLSAAAFAIAAILQERIEAAGPGQVHVLWQVAQYFVMTTAEVLVSVTGLEFAYTQAPRAMKSTIMGFWLLGVTFGNLLVAFLAPLQKTYDLSQFFWIFAALMTAASIVFAILAYLYKGKTYLQHT